MRPRTGALIGIFASHALLGLASAWLPVGVRTDGAMPVAGIALVVFFAGYYPFAWVIHDRRERGLPRSGGFNLALASFTALVAPIYLWRSRPRGQRLLPLLGMAGVVAGAWLLMLAGLIVGFAIVALTMTFPGL